MAHATGRVRRYATTASLLRHAFDGAPDAFSISAADCAHVNTASTWDQHRNGAGAATYGEISPRGTSALIHALGVGEHSHFYDLGSGGGAVVLQVALESAARAAIGIEMSRERHAIATRALQRLGKVLPEVLQRARFECADLSVASWSDATEVYAANLLFPPPLNAVMSRQLAQCSGLQRVATLKPLEALPAGFALACRLKLPFTWADRCSVFVYERTRLTRRAHGV